MMISSDDDFAYRLSSTAVLINDNELMMITFEDRRPLQKRQHRQHRQHLTDLLCHTKFLVFSRVVQLRGLSRFDDHDAINAC